MIDRFAPVDYRTLGFDLPRGRGLLLWGTYTQIGSLRWAYLLSVNTPTANTLHLVKDLETTPELDYIVIDVWAVDGATPTASALQRVPASGGRLTVPQSPLAPLSGHSDGGTYQILAPVFPSGARLIDTAIIRVDRN